MDLNKIFKNLEWKVLLVFFIIGLIGEFILQFTGRYWNFAWILRVPFLMFLIYGMYQRVRSYKFLHALMFILPLYVLTFLIEKLFLKVFDMALFISLPFWQVVFLFVTAVLASWILLKQKYKKLKLALPLALGLYMVAYIVKVLLLFITEMMYNMGIPYILSSMLLYLYYAFAYPATALLYNSARALFVMPFVDRLNYFLAENLPVDIIYYLLVIALVWFFIIKLKEKNKKKNNYLFYLLIVIAVHFFLVGLAFLSYIPRLF